MFLKSKECCFILRVSYQFEQNEWIYLSAHVSPCLIALLVLGNLFCARYKYMSLKYGLIRYPDILPVLALQSQGNVVLWEPSLVLF